MNPDFIEISQDIHRPYKLNKAFKEFCIQGILELPLNKPDIKRILNVVTDISIVDKVMVDTMSGTSKEGQILLGKKIIVTGIVSYRIEYETEKLNEPINIVEFNEKFSNYIIIKNEQYNPLQFKVNPYLEHGVLSKVNKRKILYGMVVLLNAVDEFYDFNNECEQMYNLQRNKELIFIGDKGSSRKEDKEFFSNCIVHNNFNINNSKPEVKQIISIINEPEIIYAKAIEITEGLSYEGQFLSGKALIFFVKIKEKILYEANNDEKSIHVIENQIYKYVYVVIPKVIEGTNTNELFKKKLLQYSVKVENISATNVNCYSIFTSFDVQLSVKFIPTYELCYCKNYDNGNSDLYMMYENSSHKVHITRKEEVKMINPSWYPNGKGIAVLLEKNKNYKLYTIDFKNLSVKKIKLPKEINYISNYCLIRDGRKMLFSGGSKNKIDIYILDLNTLKNKQLTFGEGLTISYNPKELLKNETIAFLKSTSNIVDIWTKDINGYNTRQVTTCGYIKEFECSQDGKNIIYVFNKNSKWDSIYNINMNNHQSSLIVECSDIYIKRKIKFSLNNKFVSFIGKKDDMCNIYVYDIENKNIHNVTNYYNIAINIQNYVWKVDSTKIYYSANDLGYYNIYSVDLATLKREQLTNSTASSINIDYRPQI